MKNKIALCTMAYLFLFGCSVGDGSPQDSLAAVEDTGVTSSPDDTGVDVDTDSGIDTDTDPNVVVLEPDDDSEALDTGAIGEDCASASGITSLAEGIWLGDLSLRVNDVDSRCSASGAGGEDMLLRIDVPANAHLNLSITMPGGDPSLHLMGECSATTCLASSDVVFGPEESLSWFNEGADTSVWLLVDHFGGVYSAAGPFQLSVDVVAYTPGILAETCNTAADVMTDGAWWGSQDALLNDQSVTCALGTLPGKDGYTLINVPSGGLVRATYGNDASTGATPALFLYDDCSDLSTCLAATVGTVGRAASVAWFNDGASATQLILGIDTTDSSTDPGNWRVQIQTTIPDVLPTFDSCDEANSAFTVGVGDWIGTMDGGTSEVTLDCVGAAPTLGEDRFVPVVVPAGYTLKATLDSLDGDGAVAILLDCADPMTCVVGADGAGTQVVKYVNVTGVEQSVTVVVDSANAGGLGLFGLAVEVIAP